MACSTCGRSRNVTIKNKVALKAQPLQTSFKDSDFVLAYLISELSPVVGKVTGIKYGDRKVNEQFYVHVNDLDNTYFSLDLPTAVTSEFTPILEKAPEIVELKWKKKAKKVSELENEE